MLKKIESQKIISIKRDKTKILSYSIQQSNLNSYSSQKLINNEDIYEE